MRSSQILAALAAAAAVAAAPASPAHAQPTLERVAAGTVGPGAFPDAGFQHAFSFRVTGLAPGSDGAAAVVGGHGACHAGEPCQSIVARDFVDGLASYHFGLGFGGGFTGSTGLLVATPNTETPGSELILGGHDVETPINAFYIVLTAPAGGEATMSDPWFLGAPPVPAPGFGTTGGGSWYGLFRYEDLLSGDDLRDEFLFFDVEFAGNVAGAGAPSVEIWVGALPVQAVPEPATVALTASGLTGVLLLARRRRGR